MADVVAGSYPPPLAGPLRGKPIGQAPAAADSSLQFPTFSHLLMHPKSHFLAAVVLLVTLGTAHAQTAPAPAPAATYGLAARALADTWKPRR